MPYLELDQGTQIYYERHGHSGPVVILVHGLASSTRIWIRQVRILKKYCQVYTFDFPGHGKSDWQKHYSLNTLAEIPKRLLDLHGHQQASIVAISMGCLVALTFAERYPERVEKLVLEGPMGTCYNCWNPTGWPELFTYTLLPIFLYCSIRIFGHRATAHWINTYGVKAKRNMKVLETVQNQTDFRAIRELLWGSACTPVSCGLNQVTIPTLLIRGENDPMPRRIVNYIRRNLKNVTYVEVPNTRHLVALEKPGEFNAMILKFLELTNHPQP